MAAAERNHCFKRRPALDAEVFAPLAAAIALPLKSPTDTSHLTEQMNTDGHTRNARAKKHGIRRDANAWASACPDTPDARVMTTTVARKQRITRNLEILSIESFTGI